MSKNKPWMPHNQVFRLNANDADFIRRMGVELGDMGMGYTEYYLEEAMIVADSEIAKIIKWRMEK